MEDANKSLLKEKLTDVIVRAKEADEAKLAALREELIDKLEIVGAKTFVEVTAELLEGKFEIEGCNDPKIPLKRIFTIPLAELEEKLNHHGLSVEAHHPINSIVEEHGSDIESIRLIMKGVFKKDEKVLRRIKEYYKNLDYHILKEEQSLFPRLEERGMGEHPDNLREEHEEFKESLNKFVKLIQTENSGNYNKMEGEFKEDFLPAMTNHMFRESFIFYPAALDFIPDKKVWSDIKAEFQAIDRLGN